MIRRVLVIGLVLTVISGLAAVAAVQTTTDDTEAQVSPIRLTTLCLNRFTGQYYGSFTGNCAPNFVKLDIPDAYPLTLCASRFDPHLRQPQRNGECVEPNLVRFDLPSVTPVEVCYVRATGRLRVPLPYPNGDCGTGTGGGILVTLPLGLIANPDTYQTLGNVDIDVPADAGVLSNDSGDGLTITAFDTTTTNGGDVVLNPDGSFTYTPPAPAPNAFTGNDTFTYTVETIDAESATVTVTIQVLNPVVWFVDADATDPGDGRRLTPLNDLQVLNDDGLDPDNLGDFIFLYEATNQYIDGLVLEDFQTLVGQDVDLAEIMANEFAMASDLQGIPDPTIPPYVVFPDTDPTPGFAYLTNVDEALIMADDTTAAGVTIESFELDGVVAEEGENLLLDRVIVQGGTDGVGGDGVDIEDVEMSILDSEIYGGDGSPDIVNGESSLQGGFGDEAPPGGDGVRAFDSELFIAGSIVAGGNGAATDFVNDIETSSLQGGAFENGGRGGHGISSNADFFDEVLTVTGSSQIIGGDGGEGLDEQSGGNGGDGIFFDSFFLTAPSSNLQGAATEEFYSLIVSGASTVAGGNGGDSDVDGGNGGDGIFSPIGFLSVTEGSTVTGGNGGNGGDESGNDGGDGGNGIGAEEFFFDLTDGGSNLQGSSFIARTFNIDSSTVTAGDGGDGGDFGGDGGDGVIVPTLVALIGGIENSSLQGGGDPEAIEFVINASTIDGGDGGNGLDIFETRSLQGEFGDTFGGDGGFGIISVLPIFTITDTSSLQGPGPLPFDLTLIVSDTDVAGGDGGVGSDEGGFGGPGMWTFGLDTTVNQGSVVTGGAGGDATTGDVGIGAPGIIAGLFFPFGDISEPAGVQQQAGRASALQGPGFPFPVGSLTVDSSTVTGGASGAGTSFGSGPFGGVGIVASGIPFGGITDGDLSIPESALAGPGGFEPLPVTVSNSTVSGANGQAQAHDDGQPGIVSFFGDITVDTGSIVAGGDGGAGTTGQGGFGGPGIVTVVSNLTVADSTVSGGAGGDSATGNGGSGGEGIFFEDCVDCFTVTVTNSTITGGAGGDSSASSGGAGGAGIFGLDDSLNVNNSTVTGGTPGVDILGDPSPGVAAIELDYNSSFFFTVILTNNTLVGSEGEPSVAIVVSSGGNICVDATGNVPTGDFDFESTGGTLGITQADGAALSAANNNVTVDLTGVTFNCSTSP